ncbi:glycine zipper 2TM domain-containing protein [Sphingobium subterraneum]|uniref:17 kDa surface antigen n=1 Tax=Sphingobium subterraneum TaxID=627688 RepID=A0A841IYX9_9SPHN|nr:glycine zipper 2TM domain-containing protein [Sphingobium subterraneum]MBB6123797.1 hypothetical protein [Sphingobium subterraneum]
MRTPIILAALASIPLAACSSYDNGPRYASDGPRQYRPGDNYYLSDNDPIYRDNDGRYYCKKPDGTTGAIVGGVAGGVLGNIIAPGGSKTLGTILGAAGGALAGQAIDRKNVRCE